MALPDIDGQEAEPSRRVFGKTGILWYTWDSLIAHWLGSSHLCEEVGWGLEWLFPNSLSSLGCLLPMAAHRIPPPDSMNLCGFWFKILSWAHLLSLITNIIEISQCSDSLYSILLIPEICHHILSKHLQTFHHDLHKALSFPINPISNVSWYLCLSLHFPDNK